MSTPAQSASLPELVRTLADDARELVKAEVGLAKDEVGRNLKAGLVVIAGATAATVVAVLALCVFVAAIVLALGGTPVASLLAAGGWGVLLVTIACVAALRFLSKSSAQSAARGGAQLRPSTSEPRASTKQGEVLR